MTAHRLSSLLRRACIVATSLAAIACAPPPAPQSTPSASRALRTNRIDASQSAIDEQMGQMSRRELGRTQAADTLSALYKGDDLRAIDGGYDGRPPVHYVLYIESGRVAGELTGLLVGDIESSGTTRYYIDHLEAWTLAANQQPRDLTDRERHDLYSLVTQYVTTVKRAEAGQYDDPEAFQNE
jgi:hypothetical protein